jgi:hypothetical protein
MIMCRGEREMVKAGRFYPAGISGRLPRVMERLMVWRLGAVPGIARVQMGDIKFMWRMTRLFQHLAMNRRSQMTSIQREMVATVVNGLVAGAP